MKTSISHIYIILVLLIFNFGCSSTQSRISDQSVSKQTSDASQIHKIYFAGFATSGDSQASEHNFPYASALMKEKNERGISVLDSEAQKAIKGVHNPHLEIMPEITLGDYKKHDQAISAAVVLDSEDVSQEEIDGTVKLVVTLRGQIVAFNFKEMKVVGSYPLTAELIHASPKLLNKEEIADSVKNLYLGTGESFIKKLVDRFNKISINRGYTRGIQVKEVSIDNDAAKLIEKPGQSLKDLQTFIARNFDKYLSINQDVTVLPFYKDHSIGGRLSTRFSNGDVYNLEIPSPDYTVTLNLKKLKKARVGGSAVEDVIGYASIMNIKAEQPEMAKTYLDVDVRFALPITVPKSMTKVDDRSHFIEATIQLLNTFSKQITKPESDWLETWVESKKDPSEQLEQFVEVINKCK